MYIIFTSYAVKLKFSDCSDCVFLIHFICFEIVFYVSSCSLLNPLIPYENTFCVQRKQNNDFIQQFLLLHVIFNTRS